MEMEKEAKSVYIFTEEIIEKLSSILKDKYIFNNSFPFEIFIKTSITNPSVNNFDVLEIELYSIELNNVKQALQSLSLNKEDYYISNGVNVVSNYSINEFYPTHFVIIGVVHPEFLSDLIEKSRSLNKLFLDTSKIENNTEEIVVKPAQNIKKFPIKNWTNLDIKITDTRELIINYPELYTNTKVDIAEIGMENQKDKKPKKEFDVLRTLGLENVKDRYGFIQFDSKKHTMQIKRLRESLECVFGLKDPFENNKRGGYRTKFSIQTNL